MSQTCNKNEIKNQSPRKQLQYASLLNKVLVFKVLFAWFEYIEYIVADMKASSVVLLLHDIKGSYMLLLVL